MYLVCSAQRGNGVAGNQRDPLARSVQLAIASACLLAPKLVPLASAGVHQRFERHLSSGGEAAALLGCELAKPLGPALAYAFAYVAGAPAPLASTLALSRPA
jgi:hypothetical protein